MTPWPAVQPGFTGSAEVIALGRALLHFVWQAALAGLALWVALRVTHFGPPERRYALTCACLLVMLLCVPVTWWIEYSAPSTITNSGGEGPAFQFRITAGRVVPAGPSFPFMPALALPWLVAAWCAGVAVRGTWSAGGWWVARRSAFKTSSPPAEMMRRARDLAHRLGVAGRFRLVTATRGSVPFVFGWLKPVLIMPAAALTGLSSWQVEAILAHELAHIARRDALMNAFQTVVECLLFYHPAVWWVARRMREEREHCCDELAVSVCGNRLEYSRALLALEETRSAWVLAAGGGRLAWRIARLLGRNDSPGGSVMMPLSMVVVMSTFLGGSLLVGGQTEKKPDPESPATAAPAAGAGVAGGVRTGVVGGVPGGVVGGVPRGLVGGVPGGVVGGIPGGVTNGVSAGVVGGVPGGVVRGVPGGVVRGVPGGVVRGVPGGVVGGVPGGVVGGVPGGVVGGVPGGVVGGVPGGVVGGVPGGIHGGVIGGVAGGSRIGVGVGSGAGRGVSEGTGARLSRERGTAETRERKSRRTEAALRSLEEKRKNAATLRAEEELRVVRKRVDALRMQENARGEETRRIQQEKRSRGMELERRIREVDQRFGEDGGRASDRGAAYLEFGAPAEVETTGDVQVWRYREIPGIGRNVEFRFQGRPMKKVSGPVAKDR